MFLSPVSSSEGVIFNSNLRWLVPLTVEYLFLSSFGELITSSHIKLVSSNCCISSQVPVNLRLCVYLLTCIQSFVLYYCSFMICQIRGLYISLPPIKRYRRFLNCTRFVFHLLRFFVLFFELYSVKGVNCSVFYFVCIIRI